MAIYEYYCENCDYKFEKFHIKMKDRDNMVCDKCGGKVKRLISRFQDILKGKGFYRTDHGVDK